MNTFTFSTRAYIEDTDCGGLVYHANYLKFFERARSEWAEQEGMGLEWQLAQGYYFVIARAELDFLKPAHAHQQLVVVSQIVNLRRASMTYEQYLHPNGLPDTILCRASIVVVCVNKNIKPRPLPDRFVQLFNGEHV